MKTIFLPFNNLKNIAANFIIALVLTFIAVSVTALIITVITNPEAFNALR